MTYQNSGSGQRNHQLVPILGKYVSASGVRAVALPKDVSTNDSVVVAPQLLPWFRLVVVLLANLPFLASSTRAFSLLQ